MVIFKHVDFEVSNWGEFAQGPQSSGTGAALERTTEAAFPDRPAVNGWSLRVGLSTGTGTCYLAYDLGAEGPRLFMRLLLNPGTVAGGAATLLQAFDADGVETLRWSYSPSDRSLTVTLATNETLMAVIPEGTDDQGPGWYCVELGIDANGGTAKLWLNGIIADSVTGSFETITTQLLRIGVIAKESAASGDLIIDEFILADDYVGPVLVSPGSDFADAPARWLVVYNTDDSDSIAWAETYRAARAIPYANLLGLSLGTDEQIDSSSYDELRTDIQDYLTTNRLDEQITGLLFGYGVPGYVDLLDDDDLNPIPALLCDLNNAPPRSNLLATDGDPVRPTKANLNGLRLTARIDGPDLDAAVRPAGLGTTVTLNWAERGQGASRALRIVAERPVDLAEPWVAQGGGWVVESTFDLVRGWDSALEGQSDSVYHRDNDQFARYINVYRLWALNEDGWFTPPPFNRGSAFDLTGFFNGVPVRTQPLRFLRCVTLNDIGEPASPLVEMSLDGGSTWSNYPGATTIRSDRAAVYLDEDVLPSAFFSAAKSGQARLRGTASLQSPVPVEVLRWRGNPFAGAGPQKTFDLGNTFQFRRVAETSINFASISSGTLLAGSIDQTNALNDWLIARMRREDLAGDVNSGGRAVLTLGGVWPLLRAGDRLINAGGDGIDAAGRSEAIAQRGATVQSITCYWSSRQDKPAAVTASTAVNLTF